MGNEQPTCATCRYWARVMGQAGTCALGVQTNAFGHTGATFACNLHTDHESHPDRRPKEPQS